MLTNGSPAPDFDLFLPDGAKLTLAEHLRAGPVVLYFYPADFTPVCTAQACMFRDFEEDLAARAVRIVGVSPQDESSHAKFRDQFRLPFPLVADPERRVIRAYGATWPLGIGVRRISYFIGTDQVIRDSVVADFSIERHMQFVERVIAAVGKVDPGAAPTA